MRRIEYIVRPATRDDIPGVDGLLARSFPQLLKADYPPSVLVTAVPLISRAQPALIASGTYYVADAGPDGLIGAGGWTRRDPASGTESPGQGNIRHFATDPAMTRRGVAGQILRRCLLDARREGIERMVCFSTRTALPFYSAHGFTAVADVQIELAAGIAFPAIRMERPVDLV